MISLLDGTPEAEREAAIATFLYGRTAMLLCHGHSMKAAYDLISKRGALFKLIPESACACFPLPCSD